MQPIHAHDHRPFLLHRRALGLSLGLLASLVLLVPAASWAQALTTQVSVNRSTYLFEDLPVGEPPVLFQDPIQVRLVITNPGGLLYTDLGFAATGEEPFELQLIVRDPAGNLITAEGSPDAEPPPSRGVPVGGQLVAAAAVEAIAAGVVVVDLTIPDLRVHYALPTPGQYTVQAHIPFRSFSDTFITDSNNVDFSLLTQQSFVGTLTSAQVPFALVTDADGDGYAFPVPDPRIPNFPEVDCDDSNDLVNPGQDEELGDGLDNDCDATTTDGGVLFDPFTVTKAKVKLKKKANDDDFSVEGQWGLGTGSNGIDPVTEEVMVQLGSFSETIPPGQFERKNNKWTYKGPSNGALKKVELKDNGKYKVEAKKVDLSGLNLTVPVPFLLRVGDEEGEVEIQFDSKGKF